MQKYEARSASFETSMKIVEKLYDKMEEEVAELKVVVETLRQNQMFQPAISALPHSDSTEAAANVFGTGILMPTGEDEYRVKFGTITKEHLKKSSGGEEPSEET